jgi:hypothetical protein
MRRIIASFLVVFLAFFATTGYAQGEISVQLNGEQIEFDVPPQIINDRTMVPMRNIFEALGCQVEWIGEYKLIVAVSNDKIISMMIDKLNMPVQNIITGEEKIVKLDSPPVIVNDRTLVPVRAISEALGANVEWLEDTATVVITTDAQKAVE